MRVSRVGTEPPSDEDTVAGTGGNAPSRDEPLRRGEAVGRYLVVEPIGRGAMGVVYRAYDPELDRAVALKLLSGENRAAAQKRLMEEARAMAKVTHPNVIAVHDVGTHDGRVFFAMELIDGTTLGAWRTRTKPGADQVLRVYRDAGAGLAAAHAAGLVHRDFKPDNVLIDGTGRVRVLDFGLAQPEEANPDETGRSKRLPLVGTPAYMAPEQFAGDPADAKSDQFAFCIALYEALAGERPFQGNTIASLGHAVVTGVRGHAELTAVSSRVAAAIDRGLEPDRADRFESMEQLLAELEPRKKVRWGRWSIAGLAVIGGAYALGREGAKTPDPCGRADAPLADVWAPARRDEVEAAFEASGASNAADMATRVLGALDDYAQRWETAAVESCRMTTPETTLDATLAFRSEYCVDAALSAFEEQVAGLTTVDVEEVQRSLRGIDRLPDPAGCVDVGRLALAVNVPTDPELRRQVKALEADFERATGPDGQGPDCLDFLVPLHEQAKAIGYGPTIANALDKLARCEFAAGKAEQALETRQRAFEESLASGDDRLAIALAAEISMTHAIRLDDLDEADRWLRRGDALARRVDLPNSKPVHALLNTRGVLAARRGDTEGSIQWFRQLAESTREVPGGALTHFAAIQNIGVALVKDGRAEEALQWFEDAIAFAERRWGVEHPETASARAMLASALMDLGRLEESREQLLAAVAITSELRPNLLGHANALHNLAAIEVELNHPERGLSYARQALEVRERQGALDSAAGVELLETAAELELLVGSLEIAEEHARACLVHREQHDEPFELAEPLLVLVEVHLQRDEREEARALVQRVDGLVSTDREGTGRAHRASVTYRLASGWLDVGNEARAREQLARAEAFAKADGERPGYRLAREQLTKRLEGSN